MPEIASIDVNTLKLNAPEIAPGYQGYEPEDLRKHLDDIADGLGDVINNLILIINSAGFGSIGAGFDGGGSALSAGAAVEVVVPYSGTITGYVAVGDQSGSVEIAVEKAAYANYDTLMSIVASAPPTITAAKKSFSTTLTGWTTAVAAGDIFRFTLTSVSGFERVEVSLTVDKST